MENIPVLSELLLILLVTAPVVFLFQKLKQPAIVGFLVAGVILGPSVSGLVRNQAHIDALSEIGVILLLFTIGLEFPVASLKRLRRPMLVGGSLQLALTAAVVFAVDVYFGWKPKEALVLGMLLALSSTAIVLKILQESGEMDSPHGKMTTGILLFQDMCVVPLVLTVQALGEGAGVPFAQALFFPVKAFLIVAGLGLLLHFALPFVMTPLARLRSRELFALFVILFCAGTAWVTHWAGLSYSLGAFLAGLLLAESEYCHEVVAEVAPLRNLLFSLFFISIGMLLDVTFLSQNLELVVGFTSITFLAKAVIAGGVVYLLCRSRRLAVLSGLALAQVGEFSFVLARLAQDSGLISFPDYQGFLSISILTMMLTPFIMRVSPRVAAWTEKSQMAKIKVAESAQAGAPLSGHVVIAGFGLNGQNLGRVLTETRIPFVVVDLSPDRFQIARSLNYPSIFGDATHREVMEKAGLERAAMLVLAISDPAATRRAVAMAHCLNRELDILVRTRHVEEIDDLYRLGAKQVIAEELETSVEIFARVLEEYRVPRNITQMQVDLVRRDRYSMLRGLSLPAATLEKLPEILAETTVETIAVLENAPCIGRSLAEMNLRKVCGATVLAIIEAGKTRTNPDPHYRLQKGDLLILVGSHAQLDKAMEILSPSTG